MKAFLMDLKLEEVDLLSLKGARVLSEADIVLVSSDLLSAVAHFTHDDCIFLEDFKAVAPFFAKNAFNGDLKLVRIACMDAGLDANLIWEIRCLEEMGFEVEVVPSVSDAMATAAAHLYPLTVRGLNQSFWVWNGAGREAPCSDRAPGEGRYGKPEAEFSRGNLLPPGLKEELRLAAASSATLVLLRPGIYIESFLKVIRAERGYAAPVLHDRERDLVIAGLPGQRMDHIGLTAIGTEELYEAASGS